LRVLPSRTAVNQISVLAIARSKIVPSKIEKKLRLVDVEEP
jgi:hypothetical protein